MTLNFRTWVWTWIFVYRILSGATLFWWGTICSSYSRLCRLVNYILLQMGDVLGGSLRRALLFWFAPQNVWILDSFTVFILFVGLFKFEIFWSNDCRTNLFWRLEIFEHQKLPCILRVLTVVRSVRYNVERRLSIVILVLVCWSYNPNLWCICNLFILHLLLIYWSEIDTTYNSSWTIFFTRVWIHSFSLKYFLRFCEWLALLGIVLILLRDWLGIWRTFSAPYCLLMVILAVYDLDCMLRVRSHTVILTTHWWWFLCP